MRFHKFISVILHPMVIPTIGTFLFLLLTPDIISKQRQYLLISIIFFATYVVPLLSLFVLKTLGLINSFQVHSIKERKLPLFVMLVIFYVLGRLLINIPLFKELGVLFYGTNIALVIIYLFFFLKIKASLHIMSMASFLGFFLIFSSIHSINILPIAAIIVLLTGILASSRLYLKAHTHREIYLGFFIGIISQYLAFLLL